MKKYCNLLVFILLDFVLNFYIYWLMHFEYEGYGPMVLIYIDDVQIINLVGSSRWSWVLPTIFANVGQWLCQNGHRCDVCHHASDAKISI